jgi:hypothetical protein
MDWYNKSRGYASGLANNAKDYMCASYCAEKALESASKAKKFFGMRIKSRSHTKGRKVSRKSRSRKSKKSHGRKGSKKSYSRKSKKSYRKKRSRRVRKSH